MPHLSDDVLGVMFSFLKASQLVRWVHVCREWKRVMMYYPHCWGNALNLQTTYRNASNVNYDFAWNRIESMTIPFQYSSQLKDIFSRTRNVEKLHIIPNEMGILHMAMLTKLSHLEINASECYDLKWLLNIIDLPIHTLMIYIIKPTMFKYIECIKNMKQLTHLELIFENHRDIDGRLLFLRSFPKLKRLCINKLLTADMFGDWPTPLEQLKISCQYFVDFSRFPLTLRKLEVYVKGSVFEFHEIRRLNSLTDFTLRCRSRIHLPYTYTVFEEMPSLQRIVFMYGQTDGNFTGTELEFTTLTDPYLMLLVETKSKIELIRKGTNWVLRS